MQISVTVCKLRLFIENRSLYNESVLTNGCRVESAYRALKQYLGGKRTRGELLTTWKNIEDAIVNQVTRIKTERACERDCTPLALDWKLFRGVFGVVTWHVLRKVQTYYDTTKQPFDLCTGVYSYVTSLLCHHIYDERRQTTGFVPSDFHQCWFWEREQTQVLYLDPKAIQPPA
jgi:hypothetical protein